MVMIGNRSCAITNRSPLAEPGRERFARVVVQVRLNCGSPELAAVLHSLESGAPRLFVGKSRDRASIVMLQDAKGMPRLMLKVDPDGAASIEFLDDQGKVARSIGPKG